VIVGGCQIWAVSRMGKNSPSHFCSCLMCAQAGVRLGNVKGKDKLYGSVVAVCLKFTCPACGVL
jgi:hypothetical protein